MIVPGTGITIYVDSDDLEILNAIAAAKAETVEQVVYRLSVESIRRAWEEATNMMRGPDGSQ